MAAASRRSGWSGAGFGQPPDSDVVVVTPIALLVAVVVGGMAAAVLVAPALARRAGRLRAADVLRDE